MDYICGENEHNGVGCGGTCGRCNVRLLETPLPAWRTGGKRRRVEHVCADAYSCGSCGSAFASRAKLTAHLHADHVHRPFECATCERRFAREYWLRRHVDAEHGDGLPQRFACPAPGCREAFARHSERARHASTAHTGATPYLCGTCDMSYAKCWTIDYHVRTAHPERDDVPYVCGLCRRGFDGSATLRRHLETEHGDLVSPKPPTQRELRKMMKKTRRTFW